MIAATGGAWAFPSHTPPIYLIQQGDPTESIIDLSAYTTLDNSGDITNAGGPAPAAYSTVDISIVHNRSTGTIIATGSNALDIAVASFANIDSFINENVISATGFSAVGAALQITHFLNSGTISGTGSGGGLFSATYSSAVFAFSGLGDFTNRGTITATQIGVYVVNGPTSSFVNTNTIAGGLSGVKLATVGDFTNSWSISGTHASGVEIDGALTGTFRNAAGGLITGDGDDPYDGFGAVFFNSTVSTFVNERGATIAGSSTSGSFSHGVSINGAVVSFTNAGDISGDGSAITTQSGITTFANSGTVTSQHDDAVSIGGDVTDFTNSGSIKSLDGRGVSVGTVADAFRNISGGSIIGTGTGANFSGDVNIFVNERGATIRGSDVPGSYSNGINFFGIVTSFTNGGDISGDGSAIVAAASVDSFLNSGNLTAQNDAAVAISGPVTTFINSGNITSTNSDAIRLDDAVGGFTNSGSIRALYKGVQFDSTVGTFSNALGGMIAGDKGVYFYDTVDSFANDGTISGDSSNAVDVDWAVGSFRNGGMLTSNLDSAVTINGTLQQFSNTGQIWTKSDSHGAIEIYGAGSVDLIVNSGSVSGGDGFDVFGTTVGSIVNAGRVNGFGPNTYASGAGYFLPLATIQNFTNQAGGSITGATSGVDGSYSSTIVNFTNAGYIRGTSYAGVALYGDTAEGTTLVNSGTIEGDTGVLYFAEADGKEQLTNSGTIRSLSGGYAIDFDCGCGLYDRADTLTITTGSKIFGAVRFTNYDYGNTDAVDSHDTLDFSAFAGNTVLKVPGLDMVVPGSRGYVWDKPNTQIAIFDLSGMGNSVLGDDWNQIGQAMFALARTQISHAPPSNDNVEPRTNYAPAPHETSAQRATETAVLSELDVTQHMGLTGWGGFIGGGSHTNVPTSQMTYWGLVSGAHVRFSQVFSLGAMGGAVQSNNQSMGGDQTLSSTIGTAGLYGSAQFGVADIDFALTGGLGLNQSSRKIVANNTVETATGLFTSAYAAPSVGLSIPVLSADTASLSFETTGSYVGGLVSAYTETGSSMNLTVGSQTISVFDARIGLAAKHSFSTPDGATFTLTAKAGVFATSNFGSASVPVSVFNQTTTLQTPGSATSGLYGGLGVDMALTGTLRLGAHVDGTFRSDGVTSAAAKLSVSGAF